MMTKDFANVSSSAHDSASQEGAARIGETSIASRILLVLALVTVVAAAFAGGHYIGQKHGVNQQKITEKLRLQQQLKLQNREISRLKKELAEKPKVASRPLTTEVGDLTFYDDLINDKVGGDNDSDAAKASEKVERNVADIIAQSQHSAVASLPVYIQLGSFADETVAKRVKQQVVALGMISYIQPVTLSGKRHRFRVRVGPYPDMKHAIHAKKVLYQKLHMNGMITRVKK